MPGADQCIANLEITKLQFAKLGKQGLLKWGNKVMRTSQKDYCPWKTGALSGSGKVLVDQDTPGNVVIKLTYTKEYAAAVHEIPRHHNHGTYKYLATPFNLMSYQLAKELEGEMKDAV